MIVQRKADSHRDGLQYKVVAVASGNSAAKGVCQSLRHPEPAGRILPWGDGACLASPSHLPLVGLMPPRTDVKLIKSQVL